MTTISGTYLGAAGTKTSPAGAGLTLTSNIASYLLAGSAIAIGGAGYSYIASAAPTAQGGNGGIGVDMTAGGSLTNDGLIEGGAGGFSVAGNGGNGGTGILLAKIGSVLNDGIIRGGAGAFGGFNGVGGSGGTAIDLAAGGEVVNAGEVAGGNGGPEASEAGQNPSSGGTGIFFGAHGSLLNSGTITGGKGGYGTYNYAGGAGGAGVEVTGSGLLTNTGAISGGAGAAAIQDDVGGAGGAGVKLDNGGVLVNSGRITGGNGGSAAYGFLPTRFGGPGGAGISAASGGVINTGKITGGNGGAPPKGSIGGTNFQADGGNGIELGSGYLLNRGVITGGNGGAEGGTGGDGIVLAGNKTPDINYDIIAGGNGYASGHGVSAYAGIGVDLTTRGTFLNYGKIEAGSGSLGAEAGQVSGIYLAGGSTLVNDGTILGDTGGFAVKFGDAGGSRLIMNAGSEFSGYVEAGGSGNVLELTGGKIGTLSNFGYSFGGGFQTLQVDAGSGWSLSGTVAHLVNNGLVEIASGEKLNVTGAVDPDSSGIFELTGQASLQIAALLGTNTKIEFLGNSPDNLLTIDDPAKFGLNAGLPDYTGPLLVDFQSGDTIDLKNIGTAGLSLNYSTATGVLQVTSGSGGIVASLRFQNLSLGAGSFHLATDDAGGSLLTRS